MRTEREKGGRTEFHEDGQTEGRTDMTKLKVSFRNLVNAPKNYLTRVRTVTYAPLKPSPQVSKTYNLRITGNSSRNYARARRRMHIRTEM